MPRAASASAARACRLVLGERRANSVGTRLLRGNGFHMTTGAAVPVTVPVLKEAIASRSAWQKESPSRFVDDPHFPEAVYAAALRQGKMQFMKFADLNSAQ